MLRFLEVTSCDLVEYVRRFIESNYPIYIHSRLHAFGSHVYQGTLNTLRTGDADLRFYITTVKDG